MELKTSSREITPEVAQRLLEQNVYDRQRPLSNDTVAYLAKQMRAGTFTHNDIVIGRVNGDAHGVILNGQHTLWAIIESGATLTLPVLTYHADNPEELNNVYATLDIHKRRGFRDAARALGMADLGASTRLGSAVLFIQSDFRRTGDRTDKVALIKSLEEWQPAFEHFSSLLDKGIGTIRQRCLRQDVLSVALVTVRNLPRKATEFWDQAIRDDGLPQYDPRKTLNKWLLMTASTDGRMNTASEYGSRIVAAAWNAVGAAAWAAVGAAAWDAERKWQNERILAYLRGEIG